MVPYWASWRRSPLEPSSRPTAVHVASRRGAPPHHPLVGRGRPPHGPLVVRGTRSAAAVQGTRDIAPRGSVVAAAGWLAVSLSDPWGVALPGSARAVSMRCIH